MSTTWKNVRNGFRNVDSAWNHLKEYEDKLKSSSSLSKGQANRFTRVITGRAKKQTRAARKHYLFLKNVPPAYHDLCTVAFTQFQIESTKKSILDGLVAKIQQQCEDINLSVRSLFTDLKTTVLAAQESVQTSMGTSGSWYEFTHAELEGTKSVFGEAMVKKIKRVQMDKDWRAVTMRFPKQPTPENSLSCFLRLEIHKEYVKELAIALFKTEVNWITDAFHIIHNNGLVQITPHLEFTLQGALEEDIMAVFEPEINNAINECLVRAKEIAEGKRRTECVSMTFVRGEGTIILALGLERGVRIQNKLYVKNV